MFANLASNLTSLFAQPTAQALSAGLLAGAIAGGTLLATGVIPLGAQGSTNTVALLACPGSGPVLGRIESGQALLVTGRSADGAWLEVFLEQPGVDRAWAPASALRLEAAGDGLPVAVCGAQPSDLPTLAPPSLLPSATPSEAPSVAPSVPATVVPTPTRTPRPSRTPAPSKTPTIPSLPPPPTIAPPSPTPDLAAPSLSSFVITSPTIFNGQYFIGDPPCDPPSATIRVNVSDPSGLNYVRLHYRPSGLQPTFGTMSFVSGTTYQFILTPPGSWPYGEVGLWVSAQDTRGNTTALLPFGNPNSLADPSLIWNPICLT